MSKLKKEYLFGLSPCYAALRAGRRTVHKIFINERLKDEEPLQPNLKGIIQHCQEKDLNLKYSSRKVLDRLVGNRPHQNVVMLVKQLTFLRYDDSKMNNFDNDSKNNNDRIDASERFPLWLALDQIHDPMNFGALLRSATYFGVDNILATKSHCCGLTPTVSKASAGAMEWTPVYDVGNMIRFLKQKSGEGWDVIGTVGMNDVDSTCVLARDLQVRRPSILVMGNEGYGLNPAVSDACTIMTSISPMNHNMPIGLDSINVSVASGILLNTLAQSRNMMVS